MANDPVTNPKHYDFKIQPLDAIEAWGLGFRLSQVVKYVARAAHKGHLLQDLKKAAFYLAREIAVVEAEEAETAKNVAAQLPTKAGRRMKKQKTVCTCGACVIQDKINERLCRSK